MSVDIIWSFSHGQLVSIDPHCDLHCFSWAPNGYFLEDQKYFPRGLFFWVDRSFSLPLMGKKVGSLKTEVQ